MKAGDISPVARLTLVPSAYRSCSFCGRPGRAWLQWTFLFPCFAAGRRLLTKSVGEQRLTSFFIPCGFLVFAVLCLLPLVALSPLARRPACASSSVPEHLPEFLRFLFLTECSRALEYSLDQSLHRTN